MDLITRKYYLERIDRALINVPVTILIGARQVGKTSIMKTHIKTVSAKTLFLNGQDPDVSIIFEKLSTITDYLRINLNSYLNGIVYIDEFQFIPNVSVMLKLLSDICPDLRMICSGSSSISILQKVEESMAGRVRTIEVYSLSFIEFLEFKNTELSGLYGKYNSLTNYEIIDKKILLLFDEYMTYGGLPRVVLENNFSEKIDLLDDIYKTYLLRDVRSFLKNEDVVAFNKMLKAIASQIGNLINPNEISGTLGLSYRKCEEYLDLLEQMYIIKLVNPYVTSKRKEITRMKKLYFLDIGLRNMICNGFNDIHTRLDKGSLLENFVFLEFLKSIPKHNNVFYYRTADGMEIDFIIEGTEGIIPVEVKFQKFDKPKNMIGLLSFLSLNHIDKSFVINVNLNDTRISAEGKEIKYLPAVLTRKIFDN